MIKYRVELHDERISVSVINPGLTNTDFSMAAQGQRPANYLQSARGMSPEAVAAKLLRAVRRPRRNRYLTAAGKAGLAVQWLWARRDLVFLKNMAVVLATSQAVGAITGEAAPPPRSGRVAPTPGPGSVAAGGAGAGAGSGSAGRRRPPAWTACSSTGAPIRRT